MAYFVLEFSFKNESASPYLICLFLWYPAFENLFSIIRRSNIKKEIHLPDQKHLHQIIYTFFIKSKILDQKIINSFTANLINLFNLIMFLIFYKHFHDTKILLAGITINALIYLVIYYSLKKKVMKY